VPMIILLRLGGEAQVFFQLSFIVNIVVFGTVLICVYKINNRLIIKKSLSMH
jgi:hypothetical protein